MEQPAFKKPIKNFVKTLPFVDRYFTRYYNTDDHTYYFVHTNKMILMGLAATHPIVAQKLKIDSIYFCFKNQVSDKHKNAKENGDAADQDDDANDAELDFQNIVQGKKKRGGILLQPKMKLCKIFCGDQKFVIRSSIWGSIIEINQDLLKGDYSIIQKECEGSGYLFIMNPSSLNYDMRKENPSFLEIEKAVFE